MEILGYFLEALRDGRIGHASEWLEIDANRLELLRSLRCGMMIHIVHGGASGYEGGDDWVVAAHVDRDRATDLAAHLNTLIDSIEEGAKGADFLAMLRGETPCPTELAPLILDLVGADPYWNDRDPSARWQNNVGYNVSTVALKP